KGLFPVTLGVLFLFSPMVFGQNDLQESFKKMHQKLDAYQDVILNPKSSEQEKLKVRDEYLQAKSAYETLKNAFESGNTLPHSSSESERAVISEKQEPLRISTQEGINRVLSKISTGQKVSEKDLDLRFSPTSDNSLELKQGESFWQSVTNDIKNAKTSIHIQMFGMEADKTG
ncbi:hypothetical protein HYY75_03050, partial [bacterium]|nr:hypothetical protein [bacterium]